MNDDELRQRFAELQDAEHAAAPGFAATWAAALAAARRDERRAEAGHPGRWATAGLAAAGLLLGAVLALRSPAPRTPTLTAWRSPTAFLLDTPGRALLESVPRIGLSIPDLPTSTERR